MVHGALCLVCHLGHLWSPRALPGAGQAAHAQNLVRVRGLDHGAVIVVKKADHPSVLAEDGNELPLDLAGGVALRSTSGTWWTSSCGPSGKSPSCCWVSAMQFVRGPANSLGLAAVAGGLREDDIK